MPLLDVKNLTIQFGGLLAVRQVDFAVERGQIVSIIGPNGAGKTTVFNAVTGVYPPTDGTIRVNGRELARSLTWLTRLACILVGLLTGLAVMLVAVDANLLWRAAIRRNMRIENEPFTWGEAAEDAVSYLRGELAVEPGFRGRWLVVSPHLGQELGEAAARKDAVALCSALSRTIANDGQIATIKDDGRWRLTLDQEELPQIRHAQDYVRRALFVGFTIGFLIGVMGAYAVWRRSRRAPEIVARGGLARTFQNIRLFREMTVLENVLVGLDARGAGRATRLQTSKDSSSNPGWFRNRSAALRDAQELLQFVGLDSQAGELAGSLSYGDQRRLEIARALATHPELLLLDEPAAGMNPAETSRLTELLRRIHRRGATLLLIEHHMNVVMAISDRVVVLDHGSKIAEGTPAEVKSNPAVIEAYLGKQE